MTNARWQRWAVAVHLLLIAGWMAWFWARSLALALAGVAAVPLMFRLGMAPQFFLMAWVCRGDATPRPRAGQLLRAWWAESRWASLVFGWWQPFRHQAVADWLPPRASDVPGRAAWCWCTASCATEGSGRPGWRCCVRAAMPSWP